MTTLRVPGVSIQEISTLPPSIASVETAIPAFIGYTVLHNTNVPLAENGTTTEAVRISSLVDFESIFGTAELEKITVDLDEDDNIKVDGVAFVTNTTPDPDEASSFSLYYHLQLFFANGGGDCYIVSIGQADSSVNTSLSKSLFDDGLNEAKKVDEPTLLVFPEAASLDNSNHAGVVITALDQCAALKDRFTISSVNADNDFAAFRGNLGINNLRYGALYYPQLISTVSRLYLDEDVTITSDAGGTYAGVVDLKLSELRNGRTTPSVVEVEPNIALYNAITDAISLQVDNLVLAPDAAVAGIYATVDENRGVWKAPANVSLNNVIAPAILLTDNDQDGLNVDPNSGKSINAIRTFTGRGTLIWGARTLDGNSNEWRYVNVRRFFIFAEESILKAMNAFVFEPNTAQTWLRIKGSIDNFLTDQWRQGALAGAKPEDAFFVSVGLGTTMTADEINNGILNVEIGLAVARPAEFIVLKFSQQQQVS